MYAIIKAGGKQYKVQNGDEFRIEKIDAKAGDNIVFDEVVAVGGDKLIVGKPLVEGYSVYAEVLGQGKADKVVTYRYLSKKDSRRKYGHRQPYTLVKITEIGESGKKVEKSVSAVEVEKTESEVTANASMKKDELLSIAKDMGIEVSAKATKADILAAIEAK